MKKLNELFVSGDSVRRAVVESLESRQFLSAAPITRFIGVYVGSIQFTSGDSQSLTLSITSQKKRSFSGSFVDGSGRATFKGTVAKKGLSKLTFHSTNANPKFNGTASIGLNSLGDAMSGLFSIRTGKVKTTGAFLGFAQPPAP